AITTVTIVSKRLFPREFQKSVTRIASAKLLKLQDFGSASAPIISLVISDGCLKAITTVIYSGKNTVRQPRINKMVIGQFTFSPCFIFVFIITVPPFYLSTSTVKQILYI